MAAGQHQGLQNKAVSAPSLIHRVDRYRRKDFKGSTMKDFARKKKKVIKRVTRPGYLSNKEEKDVRELLDFYLILCSVGCKRDE